MASLGSDACAVAIISEALSNGIDGGSGCVLLVVVLVVFVLALWDEDLLLSLSLFLLLLFLVLQEQSLSRVMLLLACMTFETPKKKKYEPIPAAMKLKDSA